jgi:SAM-dependent methyltransferase
MGEGSMELTERTLKLKIYDFLDLVGLPLRPMEEDHNDWYLKEFGSKARVMLADAVDERDPVQYEMIWQTEESMRRFFWPLSGPTLLSLPYLIDLEYVKGRVIDVGSGMGFAACFMAWLNPNAEVLAVEGSENGTIRGMELARKAGITNIKFQCAYLNELESDPEFDLVTSFLTAHEIGSLGNLHAIYGHDAHSDEFAAINLEKYQDGYANFVSGLLKSDGKMFSLERLGHMAEQCAWVGGLRNAGLFVDLEKSRFVYPYNESWGHRERLPIFVGSRQETELSFDGFESWHNQHPFGGDVE